MAFSVGDTVYDKANDESVRILAIHEAWGFVSYKVFYPSTGAVVQRSADMLTADAPARAGRECYIRYAATHARILHEMSSGALSRLSSGILPLPHQAHVLRRALSNDNIRYILADEVGLGKTIEAGLIIRELKTRGLARRVLVVCPTGLVTQWRAEMREKFGEKFTIIRPDDYDTIRHITDNDDVYGQFSQVISPMDSIKPLERRAGWSEERVAQYNEERVYAIINSGWDLVVIDEAHRVAGSSGEVARHKLGKLLSAASPYLLLLTATPHNGKAEPFLRLIRLVDERAFPNFRAIVKEQVAPYVIRTEKREAIDNNGRPLFKNRTVKAVCLRWETRHSLQRELYIMVTEYVVKNYNRVRRGRGKNMWFVFLLIMMQRLVTSSTSAIRESLERRIAVLEQQATYTQSVTEDEFAEREPEENMDSAITAQPLYADEEIKQLGAMAALARQAEFQGLDVKVEPLLEVLDAFFAEDSARKVVIFTEFVATQNYISRLLGLHHYKTSRINGSMDIGERNDVLNEFRERTDILISTDTGGEGLNLQFANCIINYDLPWNPMKIEQRIGRVDRIGQTHDVVVYNFILADTVEYRIREVLEAKLSTILRELGVDKYSDVLDGEAAEMNFTETYMNSLRFPRDIDQNVRPVEDDLKKQARNTAKVKDLIREDKDLNSLVGDGAGFDYDAYLTRMMMYYDRDHAERPDHVAWPGDRHAVDELIVARRLKQEITFDAAEPLSNVTINGFPHENGYFSLWELSVGDGRQDRRFLPVFINEDGVLRPLAGMKIWDALLDEDSQLTVSSGDVIGADAWQTISDAARAFAHDTFLSLKEEKERRREETTRKQLYAMELRIKAANRIGIENIRRHRLAALMKEKAAIHRAYEAGKEICPAFRPVMVLRLRKDRAGHNIR